jgi:uncharacterized protein YgbK (DUF1537 family)
VPDPRIVVLADDLSGAAELAGIAFAHGLSAEVRRVGCPHHDRSPPAQVIAIDTDSRHLSAAATYERVAEVTSQVLQTHPAWLYKKVDSVLRGNVRAEIEAILAATGQSRAVLIPANPSRGRIIRGGQYIIDGIPLHQTHFARDPHHPRTSSSVLTLLGPTSAEIVMPDVECISQLDQLAAQCDPTTLPAGAADFFSTLLNCRVPQLDRESLSESSLPSATSSTDKDTRPLSVQLTAPAILVCGSSAAWPTRRDACLAAGIPIHDVQDETITSARGGSLLLGIGQAPSKSNDQNLLHILAQRAARLVSQLSAKTLFAEGGATAAAIAQEMNWRRFEVVAIAPAGVGVLRAFEPNAPLFLIKPGSYPWPPEIWGAFSNPH